MYEGQTEMKLYDHVKRHCRSFHGRDYIILIPRYYYKSRDGHDHVVRVLPDFLIAHKLYDIILIKAAASNCCYPGDPSIPIFPCENTVKRWFAVLETVNKQFSDALSHIKHYREDGCILSISWLSLHSPDSAQPFCFDELLQLIRS
ncbi:MAG: DUF6431 domain-containing protein [Solobacterium sp.]|jgi:hypothetical protein|nr:DUF6431 domain-containing protein [Solobacterium sp.]MCH4013576.1 DUF6431 domain-containing protein [Solobacterium sp.]MCH4014297.1 DUF6431 domain-containing protein [Solobacterium sp.]MCH4014448.1 DUF6431 domain-containing protein [Solobacterium sp.]MCH4014535.1 DUF6431 domain-containing protein [Solobacterium sp.]